MSDHTAGSQTIGRRSAAAGTGEVLLRADHLVKEFRDRSPIRQSGGGQRVVHAVDDVSFEVRAGETLGLVGPTGCGKSTLARCLTRLCDLTSGTVTFDGLDISTLSPRELRPARRQVQLIFQDPSGSLNPRRRVGSIIGDPFAVHRLASGSERKRRVQELMEIVGLNPEHYNRFPAEFSGGQRQRIGIARALALRPKLIVCDEPVSALDVSIQAQVLNLLTDLQRELDLTYVFIAHDLSVVRHVSDRVAVMYLGQIIEIASVDDVFDHPLHPYTAALLAAMPALEADETEHDRTAVLHGDPPSPMDPPPGCRFQPQCWKAQAICLAEAPALAGHHDAAPEHVAACHLPLPDGARPPSRASPQAPAAARSRYRVVTTVGGEDPPALGHADGQATRSNGIEGRGPWRLAAERLRHDRVAVGSLVVILVLIAWALAAPLIAHLIGHPANEQFHQTGQTPEGLPVGPRGEFWLGTDDLGRDLLVRIGYGLRLSLLVGIVAAVVTVAIGVLVGLAAGYLGGLTDTLLARLMDVVLAFPILLLAISIGVRARTEPPTGDPADRVLQLGVGRQDRARPGALHPRDRVRRSGAGGGLERWPHHAHRHPAQHAGARDRLHDTPHPGRHDPRGIAFLPRRRHPGPDRRPGRHAELLGGLLPAGVVVHPLPRCRAAHGHGGLQPVR